MNRALAVTLVLGIIFLGMQGFDYFTLVTHEASASTAASTARSSSR